MTERARPRAPEREPVMATDRTSGREVRMADEDVRTRDEDPRTSDDDVRTTDDGEPRRRGFFRR